MKEKVLLQTPTHLSGGPLQKYTVTADLSSLAPVHLQIMTPDGHLEVSIAVNKTATAKVDDKNHLGRLRREFVRLRRLVCFSQAVWVLRISMNRNLKTRPTSWATTLLIIDGTTLQNQRTPGRERGYRVKNLIWNHCAIRSIRLCVRLSRCLLVWLLACPIVCQSAWPCLCLPT